jgi:hypothetical protein
VNATGTVERLRVTGGDRQTVSHAGTHLLGELAPNSRSPEKPDEDSEYRGARVRRSHGHGAHRWSGGSWTLWCVGRRRRSEGARPRRAPSPPRPPATTSKARWPCWPAWPWPHQRRPWPARSPQWRHRTAPVPDFSTRPPADPSASTWLLPHDRFGPQARPAFTRARDRSPLRNVVRLRGRRPRPAPRRTAGAETLPVVRSCGPGLRARLSRSAPRETCGVSRRGCRRTR